MSSKNPFVFALVMTGMIGVSELCSPMGVFAESASQKQSKKVMVPSLGSKRQSSTKFQVVTDEINTIDDLSNWMTYYYLKPRPELTVKAVKFAAKEGLFERNGLGVIMIAMMNHIFAQNSKQLPAWIQDLSTLSIKHKAYVWQALWRVNTDQSRELANQLREQFPGDQKPPLLTSDSRIPTPFEKMRLSPAVLDMLWISFSITGDEKYVERIISALTGLRKEERDPDNILTAGAARWSLASNAHLHEKVMKICLEERKRHPELQSELDKVISQARLAQ